MRNVAHLRCGSGPAGTRTRIWAYRVDDTFLHCIAPLSRVEPIVRCWLIVMALAAGAFSPSGHAQTEHAEPGKNHLRLNYAKSSETDFVTVVLGDYGQSPESNYLLGASWGRDLSETLFGAPVLTTANLGVQYFDERGYQDNGYGVTAYLKFHYSWTLPRTQKRIRLGLGEGLSYVSQIPISEKRDFTKQDIESKHLLNYLEWTIDVPLRQFDTMDRLIDDRIDEVYVGFVVLHRSSVFGLFTNGQGGVNFMGLGFEARY